MQRINARRFLISALCLMMTAESAGASQALAATSPRTADNDQPSGTLLLPLTPKLDDGASPAFDRTPPDETPADPLTPQESTAPEPATNTESAKPPVTHQIRATTADLKPAPESLTPEDGDVDNMIEEGEESTKLMKGVVQIVADDTEYDQDNNTFLGTGNAVALIGGQDSKLEADTILYNQTDQMIDARGNVRVLRDGQLTTGTAFKFKITSDEYLITKPDTEVGGSQIIARKAYGARGGISFKDGTLSMPEPFYMSRNAMNGPISYREATIEKKQHPEAFVPPKPGWKFSARKMVYERYKESGNLTVFGGRLMFGKFGIPIPKMVTTIGQENNVMLPVSAMLTNNMQSGGLNIGPSFSTAMGKTGVLTWAPMVQFGGRSLNDPGSLQTGSVGLSGMVAFRNNSLSSHFGYGSVSNLPVGDFKYRIRKNFRFQAGMNRFLDDGMFGTRRAKYALELVDNHPLRNIPFLASMNFRTSAGWDVDNPQLLGLSPGYKKLFGNVSNAKVGQSAMKIQEQITATTHPIFSIGNSNLGLRSFVYGGLAARGYSTGDASVIAQAGPVLDAYLGRVRLQTGYTQSAVKGQSPFVFDQFIQGTRSTFVAGDVRVCKFLTVGGSLGYNLVSKLYTGKSITAAIGPEDFKLLLSRDIVRGTNRLGFDILYGSPVTFDKLVLKGNADQGQLGGI